MLKVLFNITYRSATAPASDEDEAEQLRRMATCLHDLLRCQAMSQAKQQELHTHTVNLLTNVPTACYTELVQRVSADANAGGDSTTTTITTTTTTATAVFEEHDVHALDVLLAVLRQRLTLGARKPEPEQRELLTPVLVVLIKAVRCAPVQRRYVRSRVLPPLRCRDVAQRPEVGDELRNHLCRLLTQAGEHVRELSAELLFVLCKENVWRMTKYTGYGNAAGMFANRGLLGGGGGVGAKCEQSCRTTTSTKSNQSSAIAACYSSESEDSDTEEYRSVQHSINPVLGCTEPAKSGAAAADPFAGMSEEQREHEAMQLVQLMDRLQRHGVIQPSRIGEDGRPVAVEHLLELTATAAKAEAVKKQ